LAELAAGLPPVEWLWPGWIPRGMLSLLGAAPGAGKSLLALDLARRIIHGQPLPDGAPIDRPGSAVIYVDAEAIPQVLNQRAVAWRLDRSRLYLMLPPDTYGLLDLGDEAHQDTLTQMAYELQPELIVIDSLSTISLKGENNIEDIRAILGFLSAVAREFDTALLLIHHLRKRGKASPALDLVTADDFRGSSHIIAIARSVLALSIIQSGPQPDRNGPRRLEVVKTNLCRYPQPLGLVFEDGENDAPHITYTDPPAPYQEPTQTDQCAEWLLDTLSAAGEPLRPKDLRAQARDAGYSRSVLYRARRQLGDRITDTHNKNSSTNHWTLTDPHPTPTDP
jgi:hypothetical protein